MKTNPIILDSTPEPEKRLYAIMIYRKKEDIDWHLRIRLHSVWSTLEQAKEEAEKYSETHTSQYAYVYALDENQSPIPRSMDERFTEGPEWINWGIQKTYYSQPPPNPEIQRQLDAAKERNDEQHRRRQESIERNFRRQDG